ncbi:MAG: hypothetical protein PHY26_02030 [Bacilli bacterium]|nr:hypothetical protein [Bacilli bacterium]
MAKIYKYRKTNKLILTVLEKAVDIFISIDYKKIKINHYGPYLRETDLKRIIAEENRSISIIDWGILSLYLSILLIDHPIRDKLNKIGVDLQKIIHHLNLPDITCSNNYDEFTNLTFITIFNDILNSNDGYTTVTPSEPNYIYYIHDCLFDSHIVKSQIMEDLLVDMDVYEKYITQYDKDYNTKDNEVNNILDQYLNKFPGIKNIYNTSKTNLRNSLLDEFCNKIYVLLNNEKTKVTTIKNKCRVYSLNEERRKRRPLL